MALGEFGRDEVGAALSIRPLEFADLEWFVKMRNELAVFLHDSRTFDLANAVTWFATTPSIYRVVTLGGEAVGYFRLAVDEEDPKVLWIGADVAPKFQGRGIGLAAYLKFMPLFLDEFGAREFRLRVLPGNIRAIALYRKLGFCSIGVDVVRDNSGRALSLVDITMVLRWDELTGDVPQSGVDLGDLITAAITHD